MMRPPHKENCFLSRMITLQKDRRLRCTAAYTLDATIATFPLLNYVVHC